MGTTIYTLQAFRINKGKWGLFDHKAKKFVAYGGRAKIKSMEQSEVRL